MLPRLCLIVSVLSATLFAQVNIGRISGIVSDQSGATVPGVVVTLIDPQTGLQQTQTTPANGAYVFASVPAGTYNISAQKEGFGTRRTERFVLDSASSRTLDIVMVPGAVNESVSVEATAQAVQTNSGDVSQVIDQRQVDQLALNGRNYINLLRLVPGAAIQTLDQFSVTNSLVGTVINGARTPSMGNYIDGVQNVDTASNYNQRVALNPDTIAEVHVLTAGYAAEYGGNSGAYVNAVTKSGSRNFHGTIFEFVRNMNLDASAYLTHASDQLHYNDFGWTLGGPIFIPRKINTDRSKLFFFWSEEWHYQHQGASAVSIVPTAAMRAGNFAGSGLTAPVDPTNGLAFPNQLIPASRFSLNGPRLLAAYPQPNFVSSQGNYALSSLSTADSRQDLIKSDYVVSDSTRIAASFADQSWGSTSSGGALGLVPNVGGRPGWVTSINMTHSFSPTLLNYLSFGSSHDYLLSYPDVTKVSRATLGINYPELYPSNIFGAAPSMTVTGFTALSQGNAPHKSVLDFDIHDDLTKVLGKHILKFGFRYVRARDNEDSYGAPSNENGALAFNTSASKTSKNPLADVLLGNFYSYNEDQSGGYFYSRYSTYEMYAQDSWKITRKLNLDLGVRYSIMPFPTSPVGNNAVFIPSAFNPSQAVRVDPKTGAIVAGSGNPNNGIVIPGSGCTDYGKQHLAACQGNGVNGLFGSLPNSIAPTSWGTLAPRLGFAYDPFGDGKTAIRGGFGIFFDRIGHLEYLLAMSRNPPFDQTVQIFNGNIDNPGAAATSTFPSSFTTVSPSMKVPSVMNFNLGIQREIPGKIIVQASYVGNLGRHLARSLNINQLRPGTLTLPQNTGVNPNALRPYSGYSDILLYDHGDNSNYSALQVTANRRTASGFSFGTAFTWSRAMADTIAQTGFTVSGMQDVYNTRADYGQSSTNRKFVLSVNSVYELPFFRGKDSNMLLRNGLGGWVLSGVIAAQSGAPFNVTVNSDIAGIGSATSRASTNGQDPYASQDSTHWLNTAAFLPVASMTKGQFGNLGAFALSGPPFSTVDLSLFKRFKIREGTTIEFRAESFNLLNHPTFNFNATATTVGTSTFGVLQPAGPPRVLQFGLKLLF